MSVLVCYSPRALTEGCMTMAMFNLKGLVDKTEMKQFLVLALPLLIANLSQTGMGVVDTLVAGRAGENDLAAVALGCSISTPVTLACTGLLSILGPMIARLRGENRHGRIGHLMHNGVVLALMLSVVAMTVMFFIRPVFGLLPDDAVVVKMAGDYLLAVMCGVPGVLCFCALRSLNEGFAMTRPAMIVGLAALLVNIPANYVLVFGYCGLPKLGGVGCGVATALINWVQLGVMLLLVWSHKKHAPHRRQMVAWRKPAWKTVRAITKLGFPLGVSLLCEVSFFSASTLVLAPLGVTVVGAHQVCINVSAMVFMLPLSVAVASSIRMAYFVGRRDLVRFDMLTRTSCVCMAVLTTVLMTVLICFRVQIAELFRPDDAGLVDVARVLLVLCALYQIPDSLQVLAGGFLRGCHDTKVIFRVNMLCYWAVGLPLCVVLVWTDWLVPPMGAAGAWTSFIVALSLAATLLVRRFVKTRRVLFARIRGMEEAESK